MHHGKVTNPNNRPRERTVDGIVAPELHVEGHHALNFVTDTCVMLSSPVPLLRERQREFLERALARRITIRPEDIIGHAVVMTDSQWRTWRDIRGLFLAMRYAHERRAALSIPLPEAAA